MTNVTKERINIGHNERLARELLPNEEDTS